ncbi:tellurium resistance protein [Paracoccaceae bacterium Fryx2]|nr:tellurium resistance protein [Paracoccaceae bacterium Fryx2]
MTRPPMFPPPEFPPRRLALFQRMPPAVFPSILGLSGLGLALRRGLEALDLPAAPAEALLGAVFLLWAFAVVGYAVKTARRPGVVAEDLRILPGRAGLASMTLGLLLLAAVLEPYAPGAARAALFLGLALHAGLAGLILRQILTAPQGGRDVTPVWHLSFVGFIIGGLAAFPLGLPGLGNALLWGTIPVAMAVWGISLVQLLRRIPPAPLRPLLAIHLAPASLFGTVAALAGLPVLAAGFAVLGATILLALLAAGRWITASGFSPLWGAFTFPLAAYAGSLFAQGFDLPGIVVLMAALALVPWVAIKVLKSWAKGELAVKTNAALA